MIITIRPLETGEERELLSKANPRYNLRWPPDGHTIRFVGAGATKPRAGQEHTQPNEYSP